MPRILLVVESKGKIDTLNKILGKDYIIKASNGHFSDLDNKKMSIDFENNFEPIYVITKPASASELKNSMKKADMLYIASDMDREGEAIGKAIHDLLKPKKYKRITFVSITKTAIFEAIKNAGKLNQPLIDAQKARRVLDRLFGYLISPLLSKKIGGKLSAGRVQSVAAEIVIDKETEIEKFIKKNSSSSFFKVRGCFSHKKSIFKSILCESTDKKPNSVEQYHGSSAQLPLLEDKNPNQLVIDFMKTSLKSEFKIKSVTDKISTRGPAPPFTTSTLQQEANRKFGMPIDATMQTAQKLYEAGYITYMRTDSVEISKEGHKNIKKVIEKEYTEDYYQQNIYKSKIVNSQEAHEAIRPVDPSILNIEDEGVTNAFEIKLYKLIWQRTIASQMKPAKIKVITIQISISQFIGKKLVPHYYFQSQIEKILFKGFMKVYVESVDDPEDDSFNNNAFDGKIPSEGDEVMMEEIIAKQEYMRAPPRYTQASLVKKLEELGIGRPATFVNTVKKIMDRNYVVIGNVQGVTKPINIYTIKSKKGKHIMQVDQEETTVIIGQEKNKLMPTELGKTVNNFLLEHFAYLLDYDFTAGMEKELDDVANDKKIWYKVVKKFYDRLLPIIETVSKIKSISKVNEKVLGKDSDGNEISATKTRYGPVVRKKMSDKFIYADIPEPLNLENITLKEALKLLTYPKKLGKYHDENILLKKSKFGLFLSHSGNSFSLPENFKGEPDLKEAIKIIKEKNANKLKEFNLKENGKDIKVTVLKGKFGPYLNVARGKIKKNYPIPKNINTDNITEEDILKIIAYKNKYTKGEVGEVGEVKGGSKTAKKLNTTSKKKFVKKSNKKPTKKFVKKPSKKFAYGSKRAKK